MYNEIFLVKQTHSLALNQERNKNKMTAAEDEKLVILFLLLYNGTSM